jgi:hypothetical protein
MIIFLTINEDCWKLEQWNYCKLIKIYNIHTAEGKKNDRETLERQPYTWNETPDSCVDPFAFSQFGMQHLWTILDVLKVHCLILNQELKYDWLILFVCSRSLSLLMLFILILNQELKYDWLILFVCSRSVVLVDVI